MRKLRIEGNLNRIVGGTTGELESQRISAELGAELESSDFFEIGYSNSFERLDEPFEIADDVTIPPGDYRFDRLRAFARLARQRPVSGFLSVSFGEFYDGTRTRSSFEGRIELSPRFSIKPRIELNWVSLPGGDFTTNLIGGRLNYTFSPRGVVSALVQYSSSDGSIAANVRFRWEYIPGSEVFFVYNEGRDTLDSATSGLLNRSVVFKLTRLFRF